MTAARIGPIALAALGLCATPAQGCRCVGGEADRRSALPPGRPCDCTDHPLASALRRLAADAHVTDDAPALDGGEMVIHLEAEPPHLQPLIRTDAWIRRMTAHVIFEGLVRRDPWTNEIVPELAERWDWSDDGHTLRFRLRGGVTFHDGRPLRAEDVAFTFGRLFDPAVTSGSIRTDLRIITSVKVVDERTVEMTVDRPYFLLLETIGFVPILPEHVYAAGDLNRHPANRAPVGTGPFRFERWVTGDEIVFRRAEGYWGERAHLDRIVWKAVRDRTVAYQMLRRGDIDLLPKIAPDQAEEYVADAALRQRVAPVLFQAPDWAFWAYNTRREPFDDPRVRRAMTLLIDREAVRCSLERCLSRIVSQPFPIGHPAEIADLDPWPYDPAAALDLLAEAGWKDRDGDGVLDRGGRPLGFTFMVPSVSKTVQKMAVVVQQDLAVAGIEMDIALLDWSVFSERCRTHEFDVAGLGWNLRWENDFYGVFASDGPQNYGRWTHAEADRILTQGREILDDDARNAVFRRLARILHDEQPYTFTFAPLVVSLVSRRYVGARPSIEWFQVRDLALRAEQPAGVDNR